MKNAFRFTSYVIKGKAGETYLKLKHHSNEIQHNYKMLLLLAFSVIKARN